jgi:glycosyltransferase involved in cell wall biosynthesis
VVEDVFPKFGQMGEMSDKPNIDVLLGTFNGGRYLAEFLDSLLSQESVIVNLIVSDDGSTDDTRSILNEYRNKFEKFQFLDGPRKGAARNYSDLLRCGQNEFTAFADQDDIWDSNHLINSVDRLAQFKDVAALSYSAMREIYENSEKPERVWPQPHQIFDLNSIIFQNYARGCSIVLNKKAVDLINRKFPTHVIMHDWWALQVVFAHGRIVFGEIPELTYRIHDSNTIGIPNRWESYKTFIKHLIDGKWGPYGQAKELADQYGQTMDKSSLQILENFLILRNFSLKRTYNAFTSQVTYKEKITTEISLRFALFLIPIASRNWK